MTPEDLYWEAVDLARNLARMVYEEHRYSTRHARLTLALHHAQRRMRRRAAAVQSAQFMRRWRYA